MAVRRGAIRGPLAALGIAHRDVALAIAGSLLAAVADLPLLAALLPGVGYLVAFLRAGDEQLAATVRSARGPLATRLGDPAVAALPPLAYASLGAAAAPAYGRLYLPVAAAAILLAGGVTAVSASVALPGLPGAVLVLGTVVTGLLAGPRLARLGAASLAPAATVALRAR